MMHGLERSDPFIVSEEAGEQIWVTGGGVGGAKGGDQGEHGRAAHGPDAEPGNRDWRA